MKPKHMLWLLCLALLSGCTNENDEPKPPDPNKCDPRCQWGTTCVKGECIDNSMVCKPECEPGFACWENQCIEEHLACDAPCGDDMTCFEGECLPSGRVCKTEVCDAAGVCTETVVGCAEDEVCHDKACTRISAICDPACDPVTQACVDNACVFQGDYCLEGTCSEDLTKFCNKDAGEHPMWSACDEGFGCVEGKCVLKSEFECAPKTCVDKKTSCPQGMKIACHSKYEYCDSDPASATVGQCVVDTTVACKPDVCIDGVDNFVCDDKAQAVKCPDNQRCQDGRCIQAVKEEARDMWKVCLETSDCGTGETCLKRVMIDGEYQYLYELNTRDSIDAGEGVCTADCTGNAGVCDSLEGEWSCMLLRAGENPYKIGASEQLLSSGISYAAICRPHLDPETTGWQSDFCATCDEENPCNDPYVCYDGQCVTPCRDDSHCPLFFECKENTALDLKICQPQASKLKNSVGAYCHDCYDVDGDGYGIGNCTGVGVDCNDADNTVYYREFSYPDKHSTPITEAVGEAPACAKNDWNCNGITDSEEILGSLSYCSSCDESSACVPVAQECNAGKCEYVDDYCAPGSCSADGSAYCPQSSLAQWETCGDGYSCQNGQCELTIWDVCNTDSDCIGALKTCVKKVLVDGKYTELSTLDNRIPKNSGVCSEDCSDRVTGKEVCGEQGTCQVLVTGVSPWPKSASYPINNLDHDAMLAGVEFGAICRPLPAASAWSPKFGAQCSTDSDCDASYKCVKSRVESNPVGECMAICTSTEGCPLFHECTYDISIGYTQKVCKPVAGVESACVDLDADGYGVGHCAVQSVDCNDQDANIRYSTEIAGVCGDSDINCNGIKDSVEHIGSNAHCSACGDACTGGKVCTNKQCVFDPNGIYCAPNTCRLDPGDATKHQICDSSTSPALWKDCPSKYHMCEIEDGKAVCNLNPEYSCEPGVCADTHTACNGGVRIDCDPEFEICSGNACKMNTSGSKYDCTANSCFTDIDDFYCDASGHAAKCPDGQRCQDGACIPVIDSDALDMWKVCSDDSQCDYGKCLKSVTMAYNDKLVVLSDLDPYDSIGTNMGVCTFDCTDNATICNLMTLGDGNPYRCQVIAHGTEADVLDKAQGRPFASICRPTPDVDAGWSEEFCVNCEATPCKDGYVCDPTTKRCLAPCESDAHCPVFFTCQDQMCKPLGTGSCDQCIDMDNDGSGIGHCSLSGVDCKDNDAQYYYTPEVRDAELETSCANVDRNCNNIADIDELKGTIYHCGGCGQVCGNPATDKDNHIISTCVETTGDAKFTCKQICEEGYGFKNGSNVAQGCVKIVEVQPAAVIPIEGTAKATYCLDADHDGYCVSDTTWDLWCLSNDDSNCYGYKLEGEEKVWTKLSKPSGYVKLIDKKRDCNDKDANINPGAMEECNGYDDDCDGLIDESFTVPDHFKDGYNDHHVGTNVYNLEFSQDLSTQCIIIAKTMKSDEKEFNLNATDKKRPTVDGSCSACEEEGDCTEPKKLDTIYADMRSEVAGMNYGFFSCKRIHNRMAQGGRSDYQDLTKLPNVKNPYSYEVFCYGLPIKVDGNQELSEYLNGLDDDGDGVADDTFIVSYDKSMFKHQMKNDGLSLSNMKELCNDNIILTHPDAIHGDSISKFPGVCGTASYRLKYDNNPNLCTRQTWYSNGLVLGCYQNEASTFDYIDDPTDTNCDGFAGDLQRTLFVAVESQNYGAVVENVTDARDNKDIRKYAKEGKLQARPLASLGKALELARDCMNNYNGAGCSRICSIVSTGDNQTISPDLRDSYYCEWDENDQDVQEYKDCLANEHCEVSLLPWDILMTEGIFTHLDTTFNLNYPTEPGILTEKDGWQHITVSDIKGNQRQNILPNNAAWRIHGGADLNHETWVPNKGSTTINMVYTSKEFSKPEDISVFYATSSAKLHLLLSRVNVNALADGAVTEAYLHDGRSPATIVGLKALNSGRITLERSKLTLTAPSGANAPTLPMQGVSNLDGRDAIAITNLTKSNLFSHEAMKQWRRKHEPAAAKAGTLYDYKVCPDGSIISAGGTGAVSPYSAEAWAKALEEAQEIFEGMGTAGYYCPAEGLEDWYIYNFANEVVRNEDNDYLYRKTGIEFGFEAGTAYTALDPYQCAYEGQKRSEDSKFSVYDLFVGYSNGTCFGAETGSNPRKFNALEGGLAGQSQTFDKTASTLEISGDNFNFRNAKVRSELRGGNGGNGQGGTGAPAFVMSSAGAYSILKKIGPAGLYVQDPGPYFCSEDEDEYSRSIARSIAISYLAAIRYGYTGAASISGDQALILRGAGGGTGGCGGLGGEAGYPGGSAIGMILAHDVDINIDANSTVKVIAGSGGAGADGQNGADGGKGGEGFEFDARTVIAPFEDDTNTYEDMALKPVHAQSGSAGGGGGAGADGKPGYGVGLLIDCSRFKTFADCNIPNNKSIRDLLKVRIETVRGKVRQQSITSATEGGDAASPTDALGTPSAILPETTAGGLGAKHNGSATEYNEIINDKITDVEKVMSDEKLLYIYNEENVRVIGSNAQATQTVP